VASVRARGRARAYRLGAARLVDLGTVERGKIADLLVLGANPTRDVAAFRVLRDIVRGGVVHEAADLRAAP
jgi:imidazolonepropionase-like amidohydrolase